METEKRGWPKRVEPGIIRFMKQSIYHGHRSGSCLVFLALTFFMVASIPGAPETVIPIGFPGSPSPPDLSCRSAVLIDTESGALLFHKNRDEQIPPASMTKLMSLHLAYRAIEEGRLRKNQLIPIGRESSCKSSPPHSSLMFLEEGQRVTLLELMIGCAIPSGNDAATALAVAVSGSVDRFVAAMNREAAALGMTSTHFVEPSGYDEGNVTSAWDFARFCLVYIREHPEAIDELHALSQFTYPKASNIPEGGRSALGPITQTNHNNLVGRLEGVDGLKTGFIEESGYNIAVTASRNGRRLLAVLMGGPGETTGEGNLQRALDAAALLSYGFYRFATFVPEPPSLDSVRVYGGAKKNLIPVIPTIPPITVPLEEVPGLRWQQIYAWPVLAPLSAGDQVGEIVLVTNGGTRVSTAPLVCAEDIPRGGWFRRFLDRIIVGVHRIFH